MAEAGPSSAQPVSPAATPPSSSPSPQRAARIHFPAERPANGADNSSYGSFQSLGLGPPPVLRKSTNQGGSLSSQQDDKRRRVKSVDASNGFDQSPSREIYAGPSSRRAVSFSRRAEQRGELMNRGVSTGITDNFSDEFDLSREDPGVLEDVQRALRMKARREARLRTQSTPLRVETHTDSASLSSVSAGSLPGQPISGPLHFQRQPRHSGESEIDFSPSVGVMPLHPIPSSSDGGATLDWTTPSLEDGRERRWSLSRGKRKSKEQASFSTNKAAAEKQEALYASKLEQIRATVQPQTHRKAEMVRDQLARKYALLAPKGKASPVNILEVARWYGKQDSKMRTSLDQRERVTWMKHIWEKHAPPPGGHSMWSPTALVMEEYVRSRASPHIMDTIPENGVMLPPSPPSFVDTRSPASSTYSWNTPRHSLEAAISRKRSSYDAQVSFGPHVDHSGGSMELDSRRSSDNYKSSRHEGGDSAHSSLYSIISRGASPNSSRKRLRDIGRRLTPRASDEALSSARNSISETSGHSASEDGAHFGHRKMATIRPHSRSASLHIQAPPASVSSPTLWANGTTRADTSDVPTTATQSSTVFPTPAETPRPEATPVPFRAPATLPRRGRRRSLPSSSDIFARERERHGRLADEQKEREEYEVKAQVLEDTLSQNYRMRHLLQRVCTSVREYDSVQAGLSAILGMPYFKIPPDVLDAFLHDPSAVTGKTRRALSWRAVEDIHERIMKQQQTLQAYLHSQLLDGDSITFPHRIFDEPLSNLMQILDKLACQREDLARKAEEVSVVLKQVKSVQAGVKKDYNEALAHTSLVYPELSQIAALEENYRNQYQKFWDIGLDALTLLLDTVTPFWRNYGKVIGEDVQEFLIIPWYRNEFTGEAKRYPIKQFPRRSLRHWVGLLFLSFLSFAVAILQTRAAWSLSAHINLPWIRNTGLRWTFIPIYVILLIIQWCAVLVELCILAAQAGIIIWWIGWFIKLVS
ncbi:hypothetical protein BD309DRAFT_908773 [Dichomitus squalens]|nr:hypothetical protein BD309DRAFT_908773 [Dichomitus squalens]